MNPSPNSEPAPGAPNPDELAEVMIYLPGVVERWAVYKRDIARVDQLLLEAASNVAGVAAFGSYPDFLRVIGRHVAGWRFKPLTPPGPDKAAAMYDAQIECLKAQKEFFERITREQRRGEEWRSDE